MQPGRRCSPYAWECSCSERLAARVRAVRGLGIAGGTYERLPSSVRVPHLGWNRVEAASSSALPSGVAAFANSYCLTEPPRGWSAAWTTHGIPFVSALARGRTLACQFHPELSGDFGMRLLGAWLTGEPSTPARGRPPQTLHEVARRIVPCLDVKDGRVVKGVRFQNLRDSGDPAEQAGLYERQGADEIVVPRRGRLPRGSGDAARHGPRRPGAPAHSAHRRRRGAPRGRRAPAPLRRRRQGEREHGRGPRSRLFSSDWPRRSERSASSWPSTPRRAGESWDTLVMGGRETTGTDAIEWAREGTHRGAGGDPLDQLGPGRDAERL